MGTVVAILLVLAALFGLAWVCDYNKVMRAYDQGNPHAVELLQHGFNIKNAQHISTTLIKKALQGDEEAKQMIYAQIDTLMGYNGRSAAVVPVIIPMSRGGK